MNDVDTMDTDNTIDDERKEIQNDGNNGNPTNDTTTNDSIMMTNDPATTTTTTTATPTPNDIPDTDMIIFDKFLPPLPTPNTELMNTQMSRGCSMVVFIILSIIPDEHGLVGD